MELVITAVHGKAKMSQNQPERNRAGVVSGLGSSADPNDQAVAERVAALGSETRAPRSFRGGITDGPRYPPP